MTDTSAFWDDLARDLEDPNFLREYVIESMRIATIDAVVNALDDKPKIPRPASLALTPSSGVVGLARSTR